jgi:phage recombination protein Bet
MSRSQQQVATSAPSTEVARAPGRPSLVARFAAKFSVDADKLMGTLKGTVFKGQKQKDGTVTEATNEQLMALLIVADQYGLNPFTREIYAFPDKKNGIIPVVGVDGWIRIINQHPQFRGMQFHESEDQVIHPNGEHPPAPAWIECTIHRADRDHPTVVREQFAECYRPPFKGKSNSGDYTVDGPWQTHPSRFLRHKALIQAGRVAFGFVGIYDPDEADRIANAIDVTPRSEGKPRTEPPRAKAAEPQPAAPPTVHDLMALLDRTGVPASELLEKFDVADNDVGMFPDAKIPAAIAWLNGLHAG